MERGWYPGFSTTLVVVISNRRLHGFFLGQVWAWIPARDVTRCVRAGHTHDAFPHIFFLDPFGPVVSVGGWRWSG